MVPLFKTHVPQNLVQLEEILHSGQLSYGKWGREFEIAIGNYIDNSSVITVNSYNSAMLIALASIGVKPNDEIIASPMSCLASNQPFATQNLKVVWADVDPQTGTLDPDYLRKCISKKTKAIFHNHYCGYPGYIDEVNSIGKEYGIYVIDDAIEAFGAEYKNNFVGNCGSDMTVFSFQTVRFPNALDGGGLAFKNKILLERAQLIRDYGIDRKKFRDRYGEISPNCDISIPGYGATMSEVNSYMGYTSLLEVDDVVSRQRSNGDTWRQVLQEKLDLKILKPIDESIPNYWVQGILTENKSQIMDFFRSKGFYASGVHLNNNHYSVFGNRTILKGVKEFYQHFLAIPSGWWLDPENIMVTSKNES